MFFRKFMPDVRTVMCFFVVMVSISVHSRAAQKGSVYFPDNARYPAIHGRKVRIMPLGNSITSSLDGQSSYRFWLWNSLVDSGYQGKIDFIGTMRGVDDYNGAQPWFTDFDQDHEGHRGYSTVDLRGGLAGWMNNLQAAPDIVLFMIGANDLLYGFSTENAYQNIIDMIEILRNHNQQVVICLASLWISQDEEIRPEAWRNFRRMLSWLAVEQHMPSSPLVFLDMTSGLNWQQHASDGVHPGMQGEIVMAQRWKNALVPVLDEMIGKPLEIRPGSGRYSVNGKFELSVLLRSPAYVRNHRVIFNGDTIPSGYVAVQYARKDGGVTYRFPSFSSNAYMPEPGVYTLKVECIVAGGSKANVPGHFKPNDGQALSDSVQWIMEPDSATWSD